jgi:hypothetical protein
MMMVQLGEFSRHLLCAHHTEPFRAAPVHNNPWTERIPASPPLSLAPVVAALPPLPIRLQLMSIISSFCARATPTSTPGDVVGIVAKSFCGIDCRLTFPFIFKSRILWFPSFCRAVAQSIRNLVV